MNGINPRLLLALATSAAALTLSTVAAAQGRFSARVELGAALPLTSPQSNDFGLGFAGRGDVGLRVAGPLHLHAYGAYMRWPASSASTQVGNTASAAATLLGGGLSIEPALTSRVRLRLEGDVGVSLNGAGSDTRLTWGGGVGAWFGVGDVVDLGPIVRVGSILSSASEAPSQGGPGAAFFLQFGLAIAFHGADTQPEPEPQPVVYAPPPTQVFVAPVVQAPLVTFSAPGTVPSGGVVVAQPMGGQMLLPRQPVGVVSPVVVPVEEPRGRHRRHREGRRGGRRHREGGSGRHHRRHH